MTKTYKDANTWREQGQGVGVGGVGKFTKLVELEDSLP